jgi:hypothetical protein
MGTDSVAYKGLELVNKYLKLTARSGVKALSQPFQYFSGAASISNKVVRDTYLGVYAKISEVLGSENSTDAKLKEINGVIRELASLAVDHKKEVNKAIKYFSSMPDEVGLEAGDIKAEAIKPLLQLFNERRIHAGMAVLDPRYR